MRGSDHAEHPPDPFALTERTEPNRTDRSRAMDPDTAYQTMMDTDADADVRAEAGCVLCQWLKTGGFPPESLATARNPYRTARRALGSIKRLVHPWTWADLMAGYDV